MIRLKRISKLALAGGILWTGTVNATSLCDLVPPNFEFANTGVCGEAITYLNGVEERVLNDSASFASASSQQGAYPPAAGTDGSSGIGTATYPHPDGTGGSLGAASSVSSGGGVPGEISSTSSSIYIGEFRADNGSSSDPFDLSVNLAIAGDLYVRNDAIAILFILINAVDSTGNPLDDYIGIASLANGGLLPTSGFTSPFTEIPSPCIPVAGPSFECTASVDTTESILLADLVHGDVFGLFASIMTIAAIVDSGGNDNAAYANFAKTVKISFEGENGGNVRALPATIGVPEPASIVLVLVGLLVIGITRRRCLDQQTTMLVCQS